MRLSIRHVTAYRYRRPVTLNPHRIMLTPRGGRDLTVLSQSLTVTPPGDIAWSEDVPGNLIATASFHEQTDSLVITNMLSVEQRSDAWPVFLIAPGAHAYPFGYAPGDTEDLGQLLTPDAEDGAQVAAWARSFIHSGLTDTLSLLKDINAGMLARVAYRTRDEEGTQTAGETLRIASGSCRDIARLFIEAVRHLGFGARAVSGYLHDPEAAADDPGSTHAWAEVYLPGAGWIAFDPTQQRVGAANLVATAVARCNSRIMPITGSYAGAPEDFAGMEVTVRVEEAQA